MLQFSDIESFFNYLDNNYVNTGLYMKVEGLNRESNDFWNVEETHQLLSFSNIDKFKNSYELFRSSNMNIEYIQYKSFQTSVKIYVNAHRLVLAIKDTNEMPDFNTIHAFAKSMNMNNIIVSLKMD